MCWYTKGRYEMSWSSWMWFLARMWSPNVHGVLFLLLLAAKQPANLRSVGVWLVTEHSFNSKWSDQEESSSSQSGGTRHYEEAICKSVSFFLSFFLFFSFFFFPLAISQNGWKHTLKRCYLDYLSDISMTRNIFHHCGLTARLLWSQNRAR